MIDKIIEQIQRISDREPEAVADVARRVIEIVQAAPCKPKRQPLPSERRAKTGKLRISASGGEFEYCVQLGYYPDGRIAEMFVKQEREGGTLGAMLDAVAICVSVGLQYGVPWATFEEKLARHQFEPRGWTNLGGDLRQVSSPLDMIFRWAGKRSKWSAEVGQDAPDGI